MTTLPPFSGDNPPCPKCGGVNATTTYRKQGEPRALDFFAVPLADRAERLERRCRRCWYAWDEALATAEPEEDSSVLPSAATVAKNCRDLYSAWTWSWMATKQFPPPVQLHHELYCAITDIPSRVEHEQAVRPKPQATTEDGQLRCQSQWDSGFVGRIVQCWREHQHDGRHHSEPLPQPYGQPDMPSWQWTTGDQL